MSDIESIVIPENASQIEEFSAKELSKYINLITNKKISIKSESDKNSIYIGRLPDQFTQKECFNNELEELHKDGFIIRDIGENIVIIGKIPRATLYGVYRYLENLGVRWYFPGDENEFIPRRKEVYIKDINLKESPDFNHRSVVIYYSGSEINIWIDFAAKSKLNAVHIHSDEGLDKISGLLTDRGIEFNIRRHFFGETYSSEDKTSLKESQLLLIDYVNKLPKEIKEFFLWPADVKLKMAKTDSKLTMPDVVLMFTNEMAEAVQSVRPGSKMSFLAYWSTWGVPQKVAPSDKVFLEIAPMFRCFSHAVDDPKCPINSGEIFPAIEGLARLFNMSESHILEYWLDASLFGRGKFDGLHGRLPQFGEVIRQDLKYYKSKDIKNISTFAVGLNEDYFSKFASPTIFQYPALLWNLDTDLGSELVNFCKNYYGNESISEVFQLTEEIDPSDTSPDKWKNKIKMLKDYRNLLKEIKTSDEKHSIRLARLAKEFDHVIKWMSNVKFK